MRAVLRNVPRDVWIYRLACQWRRIAQQESFVGRCAESGDLIGMRIVAARIVRDAMKLCFLMERTYAPYEKWLGSAFARLRCGARLAPDLGRALQGGDYRQIECGLAVVYRALGEMHNGLGITGPIDASPRRYFGRPYQVIQADRFANALLAAIASEELRAIPIRIGAIDQFIDSPDYIENVDMYRKTLGLYR